MKRFLLIFGLICVGYSNANAHMGHEHDHEESDNSNNVKEGWTHSTTVKKMTGIDLKWNISDPDWIVMEMSSKTTGYVSVGFCTKWKGSMEGCDIVLGWVDETSGKTTLIDYHANSNDFPIVDESQDYELLSGNQIEYITTITFRRRWNTNDTHDADLGNSPVQIIYAWHPLDPTNATSLSPHDKNTRSHTTKMLSLKSPNENRIQGTNISSSCMYMYSLFVLVLGLFCNLYF